jgi:hypothetical protein
MLKNPIYAGDIPHRDQVYPGNHPPLVERKAWDTAQRRAGAEGELIKLLLQGRAYWTRLGQGEDSANVAGLTSGRQMRVAISHTLISTARVLRLTAY